MELILGIIAIILCVLLILFFVLLTKTKKELDLTKDKLTVADIIINENESDNEKKYSEENEIVNLKQIDLSNADDVERLMALEKMLKVVKTKQVINSKEIDLTKVNISNDPISLEKFVGLINEHIDHEKFKEIKSYSLTNWLYKNGFIEKIRVPVTKYVYKYSVSEEGLEVGVIADDKEDENGVITPSYLLGEQAQRFILENFESFIKGEKIKQPVELNKVGPEKKIFSLE